MQSICTGILLAFAIFGVTLSAHAEEASVGDEDSVLAALLEGDFSASLRYRYAYIDQANFTNKAQASTYQLLLGYETGEFSGLSALFQLRNVGVVGAERYNSTINGQVTYPVEADPDATEVDQLYVRYRGIPNVTVTVGRRKLMWGNQRFVSALGWRQNNRSFDGVVIETDPINDLSFRYAYAFGVNRAFTDGSRIGNFNGDVHLFNGIYSGLELGEITGYAYVTDFDDAFALGLSAQTYGLNFTGSVPANDVQFGWVIEAAMQSDYGSNPSSFDANYFRVEPSITVQGLTIKGGIEILDGDGTNAFQTPLALLHAFNGWTDQFVNTPPNGLQDIYASASYRFGDTAPDLIQGARLTVAYHDFQAEEVSMDYGSEWGVALSIPIGERFSTTFKYADYSADMFRVDIQKVWWVFTIRY